ncbi:MAG TPA: tripartite tricarboxylate transporter substrate-binding protein [Candidatus Binatia bacterium]
MKSRLPYHLSASLAVVSLALGVNLGPTRAEGGDPYYAGKTVKILVSSSPGGGTDAAARVVARFLPKYIPGNPQTIIQNMPGGGGTIANNYFYANAKADGLWLFQDSSAGLGNFSRGGSHINYDPRENLAVGSITRGGSLMMISKAAKPRLTDPKAKKVVVGDSDGIRTWVSTLVWAAEYLGWNVRFVYGYPGTQELQLALRQGEIDVWGTSNAKLVRGLMKEGKHEILFQHEDDRRPGFKEVPTFVEVLGDKKPKGASWEAYLAWSGPNEIDKFLIAPRGTPDNIMATLRQAFVQMAKDEEFKQQATNFFGDAWRTRTGKKTQLMIREVTTISKEAEDFLTKIRKKYGLPTGEQRR